MSKRIQPETKYLIFNWYLHSTDKRLAVIGAKFGVSSYKVGLIISEMFKDRKKAQ